MSTPVKLALTDHDLRSLGLALSNFLITMPVADEDYSDQIDQCDQIDERIAAELRLICASDTFIVRHMPGVFATIAVQIVLQSPQEYEQARDAALEMLQVPVIGRTLKLQDITDCLGVARQAQDEDVHNRWISILRSYGIALPFADLCKIILQSQSGTVCLTLLGAIDLRTMKTKTTADVDITPEGVAAFASAMQGKTLNHEERFRLLSLWRNIKNYDALTSFLHDANLSNREMAFRVILRNNQESLLTEDLQIFIQDTSHSIYDRRGAYHVLRERVEQGADPAILESFITDQTLIHG